VPSRLLTYSHGNLPENVKTLHLYNLSGSANRWERLGPWRKHLSCLWGKTMHCTPSDLYYLMDVCVRAHKRIQHRSSIHRIQNLLAADAYSQFRRVWRLEHSIVCSI